MNSILAHYLLSLWGILFPFQTQVVKHHSGGGGTNTFTIVQHPVNAAGAGCTGAGTSCAVTVSSTGSGNVLVFVWTYDGGTNQDRVITAMPAGACTGSWVIPSAAHVYDAATFYGISVAYCLNSVASVTSISATTTSAVSNVAATVIEASVSPGPAVFDVASSVTDASCTSCAGTPLTLTGTKDLVIQVAKSGFNTTAITGSPTVSDFSTVFAFATWANATTAPAQTWTQANSFTLVGSSIAVK